MRPEDRRLSRTSHRPFVRQPSLQVRPVGQDMGLEAMRSMPSSVACWIWRAARLRPACRFAGRHARMAEARRRAARLSAGRAAVHQAARRRIAGRLAAIRCGRARSAQARASGRPATTGTHWPTCHAPLSAAIAQMHCRHLIRRRAADPDGRRRFDAVEWLPSWMGSGKRDAYLEINHRVLVKHATMMFFRLGFTLFGRCGEAIALLQVVSRRLHLSEPFVHAALCVIALRSDHGNRRGTIGKDRGRKALSTSG